MEFEDWGPEGAKAAKALGKEIAFDGTYFHFPLEGGKWIFIVNGVCPTDDGVAMIRTNEDDPFFREVSLREAMTVDQDRWIVAMTENDFVSFAEMVSSNPPSEIYD